jgi:arginyl-tRNA--protein-N-Asp/Glu arginylyltransferase
MGTTLVSSPSLHMILERQEHTQYQVSHTQIHKKPWKKEGVRRRQNSIYRPIRWQDCPKCRPIEDGSLQRNLLLAED